MAKRTLTKKAPEPWDEAEILADEQQQELSGTEVYAAPQSPELSEANFYDRHCAIIDKSFSKLSKSKEDLEAYKEQVLLMKLDLNASKEDVDKFTDQHEAAVAMYNEVEGLHQAVKAPYLELGRRVDALKNELLPPIEDAKNHLYRQLKEYKAAKKKQEQDEQERKAREQIEAAQREQKKFNRLSRLVENGFTPYGESMLKPDKTNSVKNEDIYSLSDEDFEKFISSNKVSPQQMQVAAICEHAVSIIPITSDVLALLKARVQYLIANGGIFEPATNEIVKASVDNVPFPDTTNAIRVALPTLVSWQSQDWQAFAVKFKDFKQVVLSNTGNTFVAPQQEPSSQNHPVGSYALALQDLHNKLNASSVPINSVPVASEELFNKRTSFIQSHGFVLVPETKAWKRDLFVVYIEEVLRKSPPEFKALAESIKAVPAETVASNRTRTVEFVPSEKRFVFTPVSTEGLNIPTKAATETLNLVIRKVLDRLESGETVDGVVFITDIEELYPVKN